MKQGVLYLQLQQTFGKVRGLGGGLLGPRWGGGSAGLDMGVTGGLHPKGMRCSYLLAPQPSSGSPPARRAGREGQGVGRCWGYIGKRTPPHQRDPRPGAEALQNGPEPWHKLMQPPEPRCFSN